MDERGKNREKKIKHTVTTCLKRHCGIGTKCVWELPSVACTYIRK